MGKKTIKENVYVRVEPDMSWYTKLTGKERTEKEQQFCDQIRLDIVRHIDNLEAVYVDCETKHICEFCDEQWTEDSHLYNGGCCQKDQENDPEELE